MCGIVGYIGSRESTRRAAHVIIDSLKVLEYRGYDSAGIALLDDNAIPHLHKQIGRVEAMASSSASGTYSY